VIHVDQENPVETCRRKLGINRFARLDRNVIEPLALDASSKPLKRALVDVARQHPALGPDPRGQPHRVIALASTNIRHRGALANIGEIHDHLRFVEAVTLDFTGEFVGPRRRNRPIGLRKLACCRTAIINALTPGKRSKSHQGGGDQPQSTSSTSTFSPETRCDRAAAMNASRSPSSTSSGAVETTPVRRSFTC
jgi:hypothetical protein